MTAADLVTVARARVTVAGPAMAARGLATAGVPVTAARVPEPVMEALGLAPGGPSVTAGLGRVTAGVVVTPAFATRAGFVTAAVRETGGPGPPTGVPAWAGVPATDRLVTVAASPMVRFVKAGALPTVRFVTVLAGVTAPGGRRGPESGPCGRCGRGSGRFGGVRVTGRRAGAPRGPGGRPGVRGRRRGRPCCGWGIRGGGSTSR
ncbi:hypothetical protein [Herbidospora galbida]|uniref:hypothetical protein n=1 Tax=Herbidospora galbida TaxID=2575442 RepID=UPI001FEAA058|nr:hypothetical protein [Herbidospora galbida]